MGNKSFLENKLPEQSPSNTAGERGVEFKWNEGGGLWLSQVRPAIATHPQTGEEV
jgi:hypothetical protein